MELNLNTVQRPTLNLTMMDEEQTVLRVKVPTLDMFKKVQAMSSSLDGVESGDKDSEEALYEVLAHLLSCNRDYIKVTADELKTDGKYHLDLEDAILVFRAYVNFISSIANAKN